MSFDPDEEAAILAILRRKLPWPCFKGTSFEKKGSMGFRSWGYHEKGTPALHCLRNACCMHIKNLAIDSCVP